jgi:mono/diheme cytochrome c family protein
MMLTSVTAAALWAWGCGGGQQTATPAQNETATQTQTTGTETPTTTAADGGKYPAELVAAGQKVYQERCVLCHGAEGRGDGVGAAALNPKPRNHHDQAYMHSLTDEDILNVIKNGKGQMPKWEGILTEEQMTQVISYVRKLGETP